MISIITINKNNAAGLRKTMESVVSQTYSDFEFIIIDGGSTDGSVELIQKHVDRLKYWISEPDSGIYNAMNKGILQSSGDYLLFLNSGDWLSYPTVLSEVSTDLHTDDIIAGDINIHDRGKWHFMQSDDRITVNLFFRLSLYHQATFISRHLFTKFGLYNETFKVAGDGEFFIRTLLKNNASYRHIHCEIAKYIANGISNNPNLMDLILKERSKCWQLNFSENIIKELEEYILLEESEEMRWGRRLNKLIPF